MTKNEALLSEAMQVLASVGKPRTNGTVAYLDDDPSTRTVVFRDATGRVTGVMNAIDYLDLVKQLAAKETA